MDAIRNPFLPGAGTPPPELVGRDALLDQAKVALARTKDRRPSKSILLVGLRGVGKTVLLNRIDEIAQSTGYRSVLIEAPEGKSLAELISHPLRQLLLSLDRSEGINAAVKRALGALKSFTKSIKITIGEIDVGIDIDPLSGTADSGNLEADLTDLVVAVSEAASSRNTAVALIIDEMQYIGEAGLSALIMAVHRAAQKQLPFVLFGAGLPQLVGLTGKSKSYAERLFEFPEIGALNIGDSRNALQTPVKREGVLFSEEALMNIIDKTAGYPYFLQEWGYHSWNQAAQSPIDIDVIVEAGRTAVRRLDQSFFRVRFDRLTPREKDYLFAMSELGRGPHRSGDIAAEMKVDVRAIAPTRGSLIKKGMIYSPAHGDTAFTVPLFDQFLKRTAKRSPKGR